MQQLLGVVRPGREDDLPGGELPAATAVPTAGSDRRHPVATVAAGPQSGDRGQRVHLGTGPFGQPEVVQGEGVLRPEPATGHARTALDATGSVRADATEVRVG